MATPDPLIAKRRQWYRPTSVGRSIALRPKVFSAVLAAFVTALVLPNSLSGPTRAAIAGDVGALIYLAFSFSLISSWTSERIRKRAELQDDGAIVILVLILVAIALGLCTVFGVLGEARQASGWGKVLLIVLSAVTLPLSWLVTQVVFTFHYAHEHYRPQSGDTSKGGLIFPEDQRPDYWDFFYFATSIGAASQTSDVMIRSKGLRRLVTWHAVVSFFFNTAVLALAINIGASLV